MRIVLTDHQQLFSLTEKQLVFDRVRFAMARFAHRINAIWIDLSSRHCDSENMSSCNVRVNLEDRGIVTVDRTACTLAEAVAQAVDALEPIVAYPADWRAWFSIEWLSIRLGSVGQRMKSQLGFENRSVFKPKPGTSQFGVQSFQGSGR